MEFAAIDFETANHRSDSPCQLAVVIVQDGKIVDEACWLIRPRQLYFSPQCIAVHGILPEQVRDQPEWDSIWPHVLEKIEGRIVVAHNAGFDLRVLNTTTASYDLASPELEYSCTRLIARRTWPGRSGYGLKPTADALGLTFRHHDALEDARVCARIAMASASSMQVETFEALEEKLSITRGRLRFGVMTGPRTLRRSKTRKEESFEPASNRNFKRDGFPDSNKSLSPQRKAVQRRGSVETLVKNIGEQLPLKNRSVVLNGSLLGLERVDAVLFLERLGARVQAKINLQTDYLVVGHSAPEHTESDTQSEYAETTMEIPERSETVARRQEQGQPIRILTQRQLLALIPGGLEAARLIAGG